MFLKAVVASVVVTGLLEDGVAAPSAHTSTCSTSQGDDDDCAADGADGVVGSLRTHVHTLQHSRSRTAPEEQRGHLTGASASLDLTCHRSSSAMSRECTAGRPVSMQMSSSLAAAALWRAHRHNKQKGERGREGGQ